MKTLIKLTAASVLGLSIVGGAVAADVIDERKKGFKGHVENMKAVKAAVESGDAATAVDPAQAMLAYAKRIESLFPEGSGEGDTRALPAIWSDWDGFQKAAANHVAAVEQLVAAATSGDASAVGAQLKATGGTCGACHKEYRAEKK